jgi:hypothetical protein
MTRRLLVLAAVAIFAGVASRIVVSLWGAHTQVTALAGSSDGIESRRVVAAGEVPNDSLRISQEPSQSPVVSSVQLSSTGTDGVEDTPQFDAASYTSRVRAARGGSLEACRQINAQTVVLEDHRDEQCKVLFEERDTAWAPDTERAILEAVGRMGVLRLTTNRQYLELSGRPAVECFKTICRMVFEFNVPAVIDYLSANGQWNPSWPKSASTSGFRQFLADYALEVRDALTKAGLVSGESGVGRSGGISPALVDNPDVSSATFYIYRCGRLADSCSAPEGQDQW